MSWLMVTCTALFISIVINLLLAWYCIRVLKELFQVSESIEGLFIDLKTFAQHLEGVYGMEMFYGDQTLENLLSHARALVKEFDKYEVLFSLREAPIQEEEDFDDNSKET
tara:strand:+ start:10826 stop:11155 length:330 start_codon:yes stop_codon:yes gene_type:complete